MKLSLRQVVTKSNSQLSSSSRVPRVFGVGAFLCLLPLCAGGDDLFPDWMRSRANPTGFSQPREAHRDVIVQTLRTDSQGGEIFYWYLESGLLKLSSVMAKDYRVRFAPDKLEAIEERWKHAGASFEFELQGGGRIVLNNCFFEEGVPNGYTVLGGASHLERMFTDLPMNVRGSPSVADGTLLSIRDGRIPLRSIDHAEAGADGALLVTLKDGPTFSAHVSRSTMPKSGTGELVSMDAFVSGYYYDPNGVYTTEENAKFSVNKPRGVVSTKQYFLRNSVKVSDIRKLRGINAVAPLK
jgi:hypothetical protein